MSSSEIIKPEVSNLSDRDMENKRTHDYHVQPYQKKEKKGVARHCKRFWWVYVGVLVAIIVLVVLLVIFVAVPKIAQQKINESELHIDGISITSPQADQYTMSINATIKSDAGGISATLDAFNGTMYLEDLEPHSPFATIEFPKSSSGGSQTVNVSQVMPVSTSPAFTTFNKWLMANESLRITVTGDTTLHVAGLANSYAVTYKQTVIFKGFNGFKGLGVANTTVSAAPDALGDNFHGIALLPNPTFLTVELGNVTFRNFLDGVEIGTVNMDNMVLRPGMNSLPMRANISQIPVLTAVGTQPHCVDGMLPFTLMGSNVVNNGQHIAYFSDALAAANQTVDVDVGGALKAIGLPVKCPGV